MKTCLFLIILLIDFIQLVLCVDLANVTEAVCPVTWFRRKRANNEYTRWRSNVDSTTSEFIVKVLDEDIIKSTPSQVVAVNILPVTKRGEKIIVGGALVPFPTPTSASSEVPKEYTRFMPPTPITEETNLGEGFLATLAPPRRDMTQIKPKSAAKQKEPPFFPPNTAARKANRDEGPPASPQFIARVPPTVLPRQYAPIAPVAFSVRRPFSTPIFEHLPINALNPFMQPTRTSSVPPIVPSRTTADEFPFFEAFIADHQTHQDVLIPSTKKAGIIEFSTKTTEASFLEEDDDVATFQFSYKPDLDIIRNKDYEKHKEYKIHDVDKEQEDAKKDHDLYYSEDFKNERRDFYDEKTKEQLQNYLRSNFTKSTEPPIYEDNTETILIDDVNAITETSIIEEVNTTETESLVSFHAVPKHSDENSRDKRRPVCNMIKLRPFNFKTPATLPEIVAQLKQWAEESPIVNWLDITAGNLTTMENPIHVMVVDDTSVGQVASEKLNALLIAGIHGRDHHAVTGVMYILYQLIERADTHQDILSKYRFFVIPVFNPDGYDYAMTFPHRRDWMKNLHQSWDVCKGRESCQFCETHGLRCTISPCYGVNIDRNFEYQWIPPNELQAEHPCGNLYAGARQLSEPETQALAKYLERLNTHMNVFIAYKEGDVLGIMYPYSHIKKKRPFDSVYRQKAGRAAASAYSIAGRSYVSGQTSEFLPLYAGGIEDWADGHLGIDNVFTVSIFRPADLRTKDITEKVVHEAYAATDSLLLSSLSGGNVRSPSVMTLASVTKDCGRLYPTLSLIPLTCWLILLYS